MAVRRRKDTGKWQIDRKIDGVRHRITIPEAQGRSDALAAEKMWLRKEFDRKYKEAAQKRVKFNVFVQETFLPYSETNKRSYRDDVYMCRVFCDHFKGCYLD